MQPPFARRSLLPFLALLPAACQVPSEPRYIDGPASAFGSALVWAADDSVGAWGVDPVLDGDRLYYLRSPRLNSVGQIESPRVVAADTEAGKEQWSTNVVQARNIVLTGSFVATAATSLEILDRTTGIPYASYLLGTGEFGSRIATDGARIYALTYGTGRVIAYDPATRSVAWDTPVGVSGSNTAVEPVVAGDRVIALFRFFGAPLDSTIVAALDRNTGAMLWRFAVGGFVSGSGSVIMGDRVFVVTGDQDLFALSLASGATLWQADARDAPGSGTVYDGITACDGRVMVPTGSGRLRAFNADNGAVLWNSEDLLLGSNMSLQCGYGTVLAYIGDLRIFRASDGTKLASYPLQRFATFINGVTRDASHLYLATNGGLVKIKAPVP